MTNRGEHHGRIAALLCNPGMLIAGLVLLAGALALPDAGLAQQAQGGEGAVAYREVPGIGSRNVVWLVAQVT